MSQGQLPALERTHAKANVIQGAMMLPIQNILVSDRARKTFNDIMGMRDNIMEIGLLQPLVVRPLAEPGPAGETHQLVAGGRRFRAICMIPWQEVPVVVQGHINDPFLAKVAEWSENAKRENMEWPEELALLSEIHAEHQKRYGVGGPGQTEGWSVRNTAAFVDRPKDEKGVKQELELAKTMKSRPDIAEKVKALPKIVAIQKAKEILQTEKLHVQIESGEIKTSKEIVHGDARELIKAEPADSVDLVLTDPPFGLGDIEDSRGDTRGAQVTYTARVGESDNLSFDQAVALMENMIPEFFRVLKPSSHMYIFGSTDLHDAIKPMLAKAGFEPPQQLIWDKGKSTTPFTGLRYPSVYEPILFTHKPPRTKHLSDPKSTNILRFPALHSSKKIHRFQKPNDLIAFLVKNSTRKADTVLDPFAGSGAHVRVASELGRSAKGYEIDKDNWTRAQAILEVGTIESLAKAAGIGK